MRKDRFFVWLVIAFILGALWSGFALFGYLLGVLPLVVVPATFAIVFCFVMLGGALCAVSGDCHE